MTEACVVGWATAALALALAVAAFRSRAARAEATVRIGHELRGPITAASLGLQLAARTGDLSSARVRAIDLELQRAALALDDLVAVRGQCVPVREHADVDVAELLADSVEAWRAVGERQGRRIMMQWRGMPAHISGDRVRLAQATGNLIANAIEHGAGVVRARGQTDGATVRLEVSDDGPGPRAPVAELVRRARRGRGAHGRGLAIAAAVAERHGGRLAAAPTERGVRLVLELPLGGQRDEASAGIASEPG